MISSVAKMKLWKSLYSVYHSEDNSLTAIDSSGIIEILNEKFQSRQLTELVDKQLVILDINNNDERKNSYVIVNDKFYQLKLELNLSYETSFKSDIRKILDNKIVSLDTDMVKFYEQIEFEDLYKEHFKSQKIFESKSGFEFLYTNLEFKYLHIVNSVDIITYDLFSSYSLMSDYLSLTYGMNNKQQNTFLEAIGFKDRHHPSNVLKKINLKGLSNEKFFHYASVNLKTYNKIDSLYNDKLKSDKLKSDLRNLIFIILEKSNKNYIPVDNLKIFKNKYKSGELIISSIGSLKFKDYPEFLIKSRNCDLYFEDSYSNKMSVFNHLKDTYYPYQVESFNYLIEVLSKYLRSIK